MCLLLYRKLICTKNCLCKKSLLQAKNNMHLKSNHLKSYKRNLNKSEKAFLVIQTFRKKRFNLQIFLTKQRVPKLKFIFLMLYEKIKICFSYKLSVENSI